MLSRQTLSFKYVVNVFLCPLFFLFLCSPVLADDKPSGDLGELSYRVQQLLSVNSEKLDKTMVSPLVEKILSNRQLYSNDLTAKVFLLSALVASNRGDINEIDYFAKQGLAADSIDKNTNLSLLLAMAEVYMARKQYKQLFRLSQRAVTESKFTRNTQSKLLASSYRSVAFAMLGQHRLALADLLQVEKSLNRSHLTEHIKLLTVLALAYHQLNDYQTSLMMQQRILKLRFEVDQKENIDQTYLYLGYANFYLQRFDEAYNAFWESKEHAKNKQAPISIAYANKGLGVTLINQREYAAAIKPLEQAIKTFEKKGMKTELLESMIAQASAKLGNNQITDGHHILTEVISRLDGKDVSLEYPGFYRMVAEMYSVKKDYQQAYQWRKKHSEILQTKLDEKKKVQALSHLTTNQQNKENIIQPKEASKELAVKLANSSDLSNDFKAKYEKQRVFIISLSILLCFLVAVLSLTFYQQRRQRLLLAYDEMQQPSCAMPTPMQTKFVYQLAFKKARKHQYPLSVAYLVVDNWQVLNFHFNSQSSTEVSKEIATLINEQLSKFDYAGLLNDGEYLLIFEHQLVGDVIEKLEQLVQMLNTRAFANLGDFSLMMRYSIKSPSYKDIDPYLFLSDITEPVKASDES